MASGTYGILQPQGFPPLPAGWEIEWETYPSEDRKAGLFSATFERRTPEAGLGHRALVISHGIGEHGGRYLHFPHFLQDSLDQVICPDHRGHGRSEGLRGHVERFADFEDDFIFAIRRLDEKLRRRYGKSEIHVLGHSMGSLIMLGALYRSRDLPIRSATASSPLVGLRMGVPIAKKLGAKALSRLWGTLQMDTQLDVAGLSHDPNVIESYQKDRLVHSKITPRLFNEMQSSMAALLRWPLDFPYPLQMIIPQEDPIVDPQAARALYDSLKCDDKELKTYPEFFHESFNEIGKERTFEDLQAWIKKHSS